MLNAARRHPALFVLAALGFLVLGARARGQVFIPPPAPWLEEEPAPEATPAAAEMLHAEAVVPAPSPSPSPGLSLPLGISFNYVSQSQNILVDSAFGSAVGSSQVSVSSGRFDAYVFGCTFGTSPACWNPKKDPYAGRLAVNVSGLAGNANGSASIVGRTVALHGPELGASLLVYLQAPVGTLTKRSAPFVLAGFDYTATDFSAIQGWVNAYDVKPRAGLIVETLKGQALSIWGGASWATFSENQTLLSFGQPLALRIRAQRPWAGLVGVDYRNLLGVDTLRGLSLTLEGETGERTSINLSVRYGFDVPL